jgi:hypothetical protein
MMDVSSWAIGQLVIKTGHRFSGKEVLIETKNVSRISYEESTVYATLLKEAVVPGLAFDSTPAAAGDIDPRKQPRGLPPVAEAWSTP